MESTRWQLVQGGETATITQEEQSVLQKEIQEQEALLQGYQKVGKWEGERERERGREGGREGGREKEALLRAINVLIG